MLFFHYLKRTETRPDQATPTSLAVCFVLKWLQSHCCCVQHRDAGPPLITTELEAEVTRLRARLSAIQVDPCTQSPGLPFPTLPAFPSPPSPDCSPDGIQVCVGGIGDIAAGQVVVLRLDAGRHPAQGTRCAVARCQPAVTGSLVSLPEAD